MNLLFATPVWTTREDHDTDRQLQSKRQIKETYEQNSVGPAKNNAGLTSRSKTNSAGNFY